MQKWVKSLLAIGIIANGFVSIPSAVAATFSCGGSANYTVTAGVASAGRSCSGSLTLDSSVTEIAANAFQSSGLTSVVIPEGVTLMGNQAFYGSSSLRSVSLPSSLTSLSDQAFRQTGLTSVTIPSTVTDIGYLTFAIASNSLTSVTFIGGSSNLTIADAAFQSGGFTSITLPSNLTTLHYRAFQSTNRLETIRFLGNAPSVGADLEFRAPPAPLPTVYKTATATGFTSPWKGLTVVSPPSPPTSLAGTAGDATASVAFTAGADNGAAISNYKYSFDNITYTALSPADAVTPVVIPGLTNGTTYSIYLKAVNAAGDGIASASVSVTPLGAPVFTLSASTESRTVNTAATGFTINSTGGAIAGFAISATPSGMSFNTTTGALTGTPNTVALATTYTITATNTAGTATQTFTLTVTAALVSADNSVAQAAAQAEAARKAREQQELREILALIPKIGELTLSLGETTKSLYSTKCVKGKSTKFVKKGAKCPRGFVRK